MDIRVPRLGDFSGLPVVEVYIKEGNTITKDEPVVSLESEKAVMDVPAPASGRILTVAVKPGDKVSEGDLLGTMEAGSAAGAGAASGAAAPKPAAAVPSAAPPAVTTSSGPAVAEPVAAPAAATVLPGAPAEQAKAAPGVSRVAPHVAASASPAALPSVVPPVAPSVAEILAPGPSHATPSVRLFALELGVPLSRVKGSGPKGRILREDLVAFVKASVAAATATPTAAAPAAAAQAGTDPAYVLRRPAPLDPEIFRRYGPIEIVAASRIKRISGPRLAESWQTIPHVTQFDEADITELEAFRARFNRHLEGEGIKLTALAFAIKAAVASLQAFPLFNSSLMPERGEFVVKKYYNIGFAVATDAGLLVPSIKNADTKSLRAIGAELKELSAKAQAGKLGIDDMTGSTFTISSLGSIGGTAFTPIVNPPEVAILGLSRASMKPVWNESESTFKPRLMLPFSVSYDHRAIDGAEGARFCRHFAQLMGDISALML